MSDNPPVFTAESLVQELAGLERRFADLKPEVEVTVGDQEFEGYVVVDNTLAAIGGPLGRVGKGGTRITPGLTLAEVRMLARNMTLKNAAAGVPLGGAKSGLRADPDADGFEAVYRRFVSLCKPLLRSEGGSFGGFGFDIGARPEHAIWACDEIGRTDCFTGKPLEMGGTDYDREGIAGFGVATAAITLLNAKGIDARSATFAVQGLGAMGGAVFRFMTEAGAHPRVVSDIRIGGTWHLPERISPELTRALSQSATEQAAELLSKEATGPGRLDEVLESEADLLFPCATQHVVTDANAGLIRASYVVEGANNPCTEVAHELLHGRGIFVVPDIIANSGGIIAAYVELTSTATPRDNVEHRVNPERAKTMTAEKISANVSELIDTAGRTGLDPAHIGRYMALRNIFASTPPPPANR